MRHAPASRTSPLRLGVALFGALLAACLSLLATRLYGPGVSPDTLTYISVARSLAAGQGAVDYSTIPLVDHPPLYPALLAIPLAVAGTDPLATARVLNAALAALIVCLSAALLAPRVRSNPLFVIGVLLAATARPLTATSAYALSETLFIAWTLLFLLAADGYARRAGTVALFLLGGAAAAATLTRYVGVAAIATGGLLLLLEEGRSWSRRLANAALFALFAAGPLALWLEHNRRVSGTFMGYRQPSTGGLAAALRQVGHTLGGWLVVPDDLRDAPDLWRKLPALLVGAHLLPMAGAPATDGPPSAQPPRAPWPPLLPPALFASLYLVLIVAAAALVRFDSLSDRMLAPIHVPLLVTLLGALDLWTRREAAPVWRRPVALGLALLLLFLSGTGTLVRAVKLAEEGAGGLNRRSWQESAMVVELRAGLPDQTPAIYSNAPDVVYYFLARVVHMGPRRDPHLRGMAPVSLEELRGAWPPEDEALLLWFDREERAYLFRPEELAAVSELTLERTFDDGALYRVRRLP